MPLSSQFLRKTPGPALIDERLRFGSADRVHLHGLSPAREPEIAGFIRLNDDVARAAFNGESK